MASLDKIALALSDPIRLAVLDLLAAGRTDVCCSPNNPEQPAAICSCDLLPQLALAPSKLSYHMKELREAGLVTEEKRGRWVYFSLNRASLRAFQRAIAERFLSPQPTQGCCRSTHE